MNASAVSDRVEDVRARVRRAGGDPSSVTIVAVTKGFGPDAVQAAMDAGLHDIGENYAQELTAKWTKGPRWHFLGALQRNKVGTLSRCVNVWQSVDRDAEGASIADHAPGACVYVQVNVSGEPQKAGCTWEEAPRLVEQLRNRGLDVQGLMAVGPAGEPEEARLPFRRLAVLARSLETPEVSMGMTADLEVAVQEGATMVRVGTALFGMRPPRGTGDDRLDQGGT
jgi:pyridoxal phosphate enzyme (YggS family)